MERSANSRKYVFATKISRETYTRGHRCGGKTRKKFSRCRIAARAEKTARLMCAGHGTARARRRCLNTYKLAILNGSRYRRI